jgi:dephospho-CoA kinase
MYIIGLTGGIGSGKTSVSTMLRGIGAWVIDADEVAHELIVPGKPAWQKIVDCFGPAVLRDDETIDRARLGSIVFNDVALRGKLEKIIHPDVEREIFCRVADGRRQGRKIAVLDVPLLIEIGWHRRVNEVWLVYVNPEKQLERLMARNHFSKAEATARIRAQFSLEEKMREAHDVIDNNGQLMDTEKQVLTLWRNLQNKIK